MPERPRRDRGRAPHADSRPTERAPQREQPSVSDFEKTVPEDFLKGFRELERLRQRNTKEEDQIPFASRALGPTVNYPEFKAASEKWLSLKRSERRKAEGLPDERKRRETRQERKAEPKAQPPREPAPKREPMPFNPDGSHPLDVKPERMGWREWKLKRKSLGLPAYPAHMQKERQEHGRRAAPRDRRRPPGGDSPEKRLFDDVFRQLGAKDLSRGGEQSPEHMTEEELLRGLEGLAPPVELEPLSDTGEKNVNDAWDKFEVLLSKQAQPPQLAFRNAVFGLTANERAHLERKLIGTGKWKENDLVDEATRNREKDDRIRSGLEAARRKRAEEAMPAIERGVDKFLDTIRNSTNFVEALRAARVEVPHGERDLLEKYLVEKGGITEAEIEFANKVLTYDYNEPYTGLVEKLGPPKFFHDVAYWTARDGSALVCEHGRTHKLQDGDTYPFPDAEGRGYERWYWNTHEFIFSEKIPEKDARHLRGRWIRNLFQPMGAEGSRLIPREEAIADAEERARTPDELKDMITRRFKGIGAKLKINPDSTGELTTGANPPRTRPPRKRAQRRRSRAGDPGYMGDNWERES